MMYGFGYLWMIIPALFLIGVIALVVWALARAFPATGGGERPRKDRAEEILEERFARGEITAEEYRDSLRVLREKAGPRSRI
jgi:putative membrane protein